MIKKLTILGFVFIFCLIEIGSAQNSSLPQSKNTFYLEKGKKAFEELKYQNAVTNFKRATKKEASQNNANYGLAMSYLQNSQYKSALSAFEKLQPDLYGHDFFVYYLYTLKANGKYTEALSKCIEYMKKYSDENKDIYNFVESLKSIKTIGNNHWDAKIGFVNFNSNGRDYSPMIVGDKLVYLSNKRSNAGLRTYNYNLGDENNNATFSKLYLIDNVAKIVSKPLNLGDSAVLADINSDGNNSMVELLDQRDMNIGPVSFTNDNKTIYYTLNYKIRNKVTSWLRIMKADFSSGKITKSIQFPHNNQEYAIEHPAITPDGRFLFFTSNKKETGIGGFDLYRCESTGSDGDWKYPVNLGTVVNTNGNEMFPYVDAKGYLFFASDRLPGLGGLDLFRVKLMNGLPAGKPENLGAPMNSTSDDFGITFSADGKFGFFSSNRRNENDDIYQFTINIKDAKSKYIGGIVYDNTTKLRIFDATLDFKFNNQDLDFSINSDTAGAFNSLLDDEITQVKVNANKEGYEEFVANVKTDSVEGNSLIIYLKPKIDSSLLVKNGNQYEDLDKGDKNTFTFANGNRINEKELKYQVFYGFNESKVLGNLNQNNLDRAARELEENPNNVIIVASFTDCVGSNEYNIRLSAKRSETVKEYLLSRGISAKRIKVYNYGEQYLIEQCKGNGKNKVAQAINRRSDIYISSADNMKENFDPIKNKYKKSTDSLDASEDYIIEKTYNDEQTPVFSLKSFKTLSDTLLQVIYFNQNKLDIDNSFDELFNLKEFLRMNKEFKISLNGHADLTELEAEYQLSRRRTEVIKNYFVSYYINPSRIFMANFGKKKPAINSIVDKNLSWKNRRVEIKIFR
jgi:outer membrane protein OmpA-like peptidoglycan-associated protein